MSRLSGKIRFPRVLWGCLKGRISGTTGILTRSTIRPGSPGAESPPPVRGGAGGWERHQSPTGPSEARPWRAARPMTAGLPRRYTPSRASGTLRFRWRQGRFEDSRSLCGTTAYITRNHGYLVYDTLVRYGRELSNQNRRMVDRRRSCLPDGHEVHRSHCRDGLQWHDGPAGAVGKDCVESLKRLGQEGSLRFSFLWRIRQGSRPVPTRRRSTLRTRRALRSRARTHLAKAIEQCALYDAGRGSPPPRLPRCSSKRSSALGPFKFREG